MSSLDKLIHNREELKRLLAVTPVTSPGYDALRCSLSEVEINIANASNSLGRKSDKGKNRLSLIPVKCLNAIMEVLEFGAIKYEIDNWQKVPDAETRYYDAAMRHLMAWREGESLDPESGKHHLAHAACCVIFMLWFELGKKEKQ